ncbi:MAG TPA: hypothetical protein VG455_14540 [Acidimicrobiales bacterium]|nr:hypothetical protein [Acidimicrobiales bacterium]
MPDPDPIIGRALALGAAGAGRTEAAEELVRLSEGRREPLALARDRFVARLHADSADYEATKALLLVNAALSRVGWSTGADG